MTEYDAYQGILNELARTRMALDELMSKIAVQAPREVHADTRKLIDSALEAMLDHAVVPMVTKYPTLDQDHIWLPVKPR